jgi:HK97 family phage portal protein
MVVEMERRLPDDLFRRLRAQLEQTYGGIDNSFKIAILELGMKLKEVSATNSDSQLIEVRKESAAEQARLWRVPPHKIGVLDKATFSNIEQQNIEYVTDCLAPLASMVEQALTTALLSETEQDEYEIEFNLDGLLRGDLLSRYRAYSIGRQWGWLSADDIREAENKPSLPNGQGKVYLTPLNMVPAGEDPMNDGPADAPPAKPPSRATSLVDLHGRPLMLPAPAPTPAPTH